MIRIPANHLVSPIHVYNMLCLCYVQLTKIWTTAELLHDIFYAPFFTDCSHALWDTNLLWYPILLLVTGKEIEKACQGIYPLQNVYIRKVKILRAPKFDITKLMEVCAFLCHILNGSRENDLSSRQNDLLCQMGSLWTLLDWTSKDWQFWWEYDCKGTWGMDTTWDGFQLQSSLFFTL